MMKDHGVGSIPVCENNKVVGLVTDRDIAVRAVAVHKHHAPLKEIMTNDIITGDPEMKIEEAVQLMENRQIRRLPITAGDHLVGIVSIGDLAVEGLTNAKVGEAITEISRPLN
jgi:CBS domain-containing protein